MKFNGVEIKATFGYNKFCNYFLKNKICKTKNC